MGVPGPRRAQERRGLDGALVVLLLCAVGVPPTLLRGTPEVREPPQMLGTGALHRIAPMVPMQLLAETTIADATQADGGQNPPQP